jgi:ferredoxin
MLKNIFDAIMKVTDPRPKYTGTRCLVERQVVGGCDLCMQACPHDAVRITDRVEIIEADCTGCGLCVQVCPTGALEYELPVMLNSLKSQGTTHSLAMGNDRVNTSLKCSKVPGDSPTIPCLARVSPSMILASSAWGQKLTLIRNDCSTCSLGGDTVPQAIENVLEIARAYRENIGAVVTEVVQYGIDETTKLETPKPPEQPAVHVSRRDAFNVFGMGLKRTTADLIPENPFPGISTKLEAAPVPIEWTWRKKALRPKPENQMLQYWPAPTVNDDCIFCPVCQNVCPTSAVTREREVDGTFKIMLETAACTGCNACVVSCPPAAMTLEPSLKFEALEETVLLHEGTGD